MNVLLVTLGSHGDIHPFVALGRALRARGHRAAILTNPHFAPLIGHAGLECLPIGDAQDIRDIITTRPVMDAHRGPLTVMRELMLPLVPQIYQRTLDSLRDLRIDSCLTHPICMGAPWACERAGVPCDNVALAPSLWFNPRDALVMTAWGSPEPRRWVVRAQVTAARLLMRLALDPGLNRARRDLGLGRIRDGFFTAALGGRHNLALWSPLFRDALPSDPPTGRLCGFPWHDSLGGDDPEWVEIERFLGEGEPPILFTLGTAAVHAPGAFYAQAAHACSTLGRRGILLVGREDARPRGLPPGIGAFAYAPYSKLLPRCAAAVHHAGIGTTAQVLRSGRPSVPVPFAHDQFDNAARLQRLGVARIAKRGSGFVARLAGALGHVLDDPSLVLRASELGAQIAREDGAAAAVEIIAGVNRSAAAPAERRPPVP